MSRNCARVCVRHVGTGRAEVLDEVDLTGEHGLEALRQRLEQVFAVPVACQRLRAGVPPRLVETAADIQPLDTILLESTVPETPHHRRRSSTNTNTASRNRRRPVGTRGAKQLATDAAIQPAEATAALGTQLVNALSGSAGSAREAQAFRRALREARTEHDQEVRAADRYRAALARSYHVVREESDNADTGASGNASPFGSCSIPRWAHARQCTKTPMCAVCLWMCCGKSFGRSTACLLNIERICDQRKWHRCHHSCFGTSSSTGGV